MKSMLQRAALPGFELLVIGVWAVVLVTRFLMSISIRISFLRVQNFCDWHFHANHTWTRFQECGLCALWNGSVRGGYPAFADVRRACCTR